MKTRRMKCRKKRMTMWTRNGKWKAERRRRMRRRREKPRTRAAATAVRA
jgi:hypothetical protein